MSTLWTPGGEHPVGRPAGSPGSGPSGPSRPPAPDRPPPPSDPADDEALAEQLAAMQAELASAPAEVVVVNHCYGLFELAALYLSQQPARIEEARLAIDALGSLVEGLQGRLGEGEAQLRDGLSQLRLAYVQIDGARRAGAEVASAAAANGGSTGSRPDPRTASEEADGTPTGASDAGGRGARADEGGVRPERSDPDG